MKPIIYLYFHSKILKWKGKEISERDFRSSFFQWRIPKNLRYLVAKEMEKMGLIKMKNKKVYLNDYYWDDNDSIKKFALDLKDPNTKKENPYKKI
jgi:hypothetical protein